MKTKTIQTLLLGLLFLCTAALRGQEQM